MADIIVKVEDKDYSYIGFTFNGKHSIKDFGIYRVSDDKEGYDEKLTLEKNDKVASHFGIEGEYYLGTQHKGRVFNIKIAFDGLTEQKLQAARKWLSTIDEKELWFSENPHKVYYARVANPPQITTMSFLDENGRRVYKGTGSISFACTNPFGVTPDYVDNNGTRLDGKVYTSYAAFPIYNEIKEQLPGYYTMPDFYLVYGETAYGDSPSYFIASLQDFDYKITYHANNSSKATTTQNVPSENPTVIIATNPFTEEDGYYFIGWNTEPDGSGENYTENNSATITKNLSLYARWSRNNTVIYHANNGTGATDTQSLEQSQFNITLKKNTFTYSGNYFVGWNTAKDGSGTFYPDEKANVYVLGVLNLYAQWSTGYGITYYSNNSHNKSSTISLKPDPYDGNFKKNVQNNSEIGLPADTGDKFAGWNTKADGSGTTYRVGTSIQNQNIILYAMWNNEYSITISHSENKSWFFSSTMSDHYDERAVKINGTYLYLDDIDTGSKIFSAKYGQDIEIQVRATSGWYCDVYVNGSSIYQGGSIYARFKCPANDVSIDLKYKSKLTTVESFEDIWNGTYRRTCWDPTISGVSASAIQCGNL